MSGYATKVLHLLAAIVALLVLALSVATPLPLQALVAHRDDGANGSTSIPHWQSPAKLHRGLKAATGTLVFDSNEIEFHSDDRRVFHRWPYVEVKTLDLTSRRLVLTDYENRTHHMPGERHFRFDLNNPVPSSVAAELAQRVNKPVRNGDPDPKATAYLTIPARHDTRFGGTNGILRFRAKGIDYVTLGGRDSRAWRWADIETLANPTPYRLRVGAYLETFDFELKRPMSPDLFDRLWDDVYARALNVGQTRRGEQHAEH